MKVLHWFVMWRYLFAYWRDREELSWILWWWYRLDGLLFWLGKSYVKLFARYFLCIPFLWHNHMIHECEIDYFAVNITEMFTFMCTVGTMPLFLLLHSLGTKLGLCCNLFPNWYNLYRTIPFMFSTFDIGLWSPHPTKRGTICLKCSEVSCIDFWW